MIEWFNSMWFNVSSAFYIWDNFFFSFHFQEEQGIAAVPKQVSFIAALFKSTSGNPAENLMGAG